MSGAQCGRRVFRAVMECPAVDGAQEAAVRGQRGSFVLRGVVGSFCWYFVADSRWWRWTRRIANVVLLYCVGLCGVLSAAALQWSWVHLLVAIGLAEFIDLELRTGHWTLTILKAITNILIYCSCYTLRRAQKVRGSTLSHLRGEWAFSKVFNSCGLVPALF